MSKRQRTDNEEVNTAVPPRRSAETWYRDGNVVLQAGNTQFKVHQGLLERHSPVFAGLLVEGQQGGEDTVEGCRVVKLEESEEDIELLLDALYNPRPNIKVPVPFKTVSAMMRMGLEYEIPHLREGALKRLTLEFPTTLEEYDERGGAWTSIIEEKGLLFKIVNLAHECDIHTILPAAYMRCLDDMDALLHGELMGEEPDSPRSEAACLTAVRACFAGREALYVAFNRTFAWARKLGETCDQDECYYETRPWLRAVLWIPAPKISQVLLNWEGLTREEVSLKNGLCAECSKEARQKFEAERTVTWRKLPEYFGLPKWKDLTSP
ncbi:hypothetical protein D9611_007348 [Ephemerocybe angulata]|uniref:BTB domain-containing protein n=1 Tax=Ephemerocybe angulata TaxID=980116 RepID=A0A8H5CF29_9AGAR|nr:hypothetical protein D9611_007348 [Tulosesus angulatus]